MDVRDCSMQMMKGVKILALFLGFVATNARANFLFQWHFAYPQLQQFDASFQITDAEMQPGTDWGSDLFHQTLLITSRSGAVYHGDPAWSDFNSSYGPPFTIDFVVHDDTHTHSIAVTASGFGTTTDPIIGR